MYNVSFDNKIGLYEKHERDERTAYVMFCEKTLKLLPSYTFRKGLVYTAANYNNEGFYHNVVTYLGKVFRYQSSVNDIPNIEFDRYDLFDTIVYQYHIEFFFFFVCFENQLGKFERELDDELIFDS